MSAEAAAPRLGFIDEAWAFEPLPAFAADGDSSPTRPCALAEAAALRWHEQHAGVPD